MNKEIKYVSPFKKLCITVGNLPTAYIESMSYYEGLTFLVNYLSNNVIPALNNNGQVVNELKEYVENYFENLDVQEEINNKLDEMAESGQLTDIIAQYLQLGGVLAFNTVTDMKNAENLVDGSIVKTLGYYSYNDGGGSFYKIRTITNDDIVNDKDIIELFDNYLVAELITNEKLNIKTFGAVGDGNFDNTDIIREAIAYCKRKNTGLYVPIGIYNVSGNFNIDFSLKIQGEHVGNWHYNTSNLSDSLMYASVINDINSNVNNPEYYLFNCDTNNRGCIEINDIHIQGQNNKHSCINLSHAGWTFYSDNLTIDNFWYKAINTLTQYDSNINNLTIERCGKGIYNNIPQYAITLSRYASNETNTNALHFNNLHMEFCRYYINFDINQDVSINNSKIEIFRHTDSYKDRTDIGQVDNDLTNPHILINSNHTRVIFTNTTFCFRGLYNWNLANPEIEDMSSFPYSILTNGNDSTSTDVSFVGCTIFSPDNDGGFRFLNNSGQCFIHIRDCFLGNLSLRASAINGTKFNIVNSRLHYYVHSSINSFEGIGSTLTDSIITNNTIITTNSIINKCTNNTYNGFKIINADSSCIMNNNRITPFCNLSSLYGNSSIITLNSTSGTLVSNTTTIQKTGNAKIKLNVTIPNGGNDGRFYLKLSSNRSNDYNILFYQSIIPSNTTNLTFYIDEVLRRGEILTLELIQTSTVNKNITAQFQYMYC